jgi:hypothetical protein
VAKASELSNQDFLHSHLAEYLDGDMTPADLARIEGLVNAGEAEKAAPERFLAMRGRLQLAMQSYYLKEAEHQELRSYVQDPAVLATQENIRIDQLGRGEVVNTLLRRLALVGIAAGLVALAVWKFAPGAEVKFKPLEYLGYEAMAMEEDPRDRLDLPSADMKEIRQYLAAYPGLDFKPAVLKQIPNDWKPDGATVIDYEIAKVAVVQYSNSASKEKLFHFSYAGAMADLPRSEPGNLKGLVYQTYASDELNIIAWNQGDGLTSLLVGRRSAPELAEIAVLGSK